MSKSKHKREAYEALLRTDFFAFLQRCHETLYENEPFQDNWHVQAMIYNMKLALAGKRPRLIINLPPRHLKSFIFSVALPAWILAQNPSARIMTISYADKLTDKHMEDFRKILDSIWYQKMFPQTKIGRKNTKTEVETTKNGYRLSVSVHGSLTGRGANYIIIDDPIKAEDVYSDPIRTGVNEWYRNTLYSRFDNKKKCVCILVMQRLHQNDLTGFLQDLGGFYTLSLPAIAEKDEKIEIGEDDFYFRKAGEALHPEREDLETHEETRRTQGELIFASQYQQAPVPLEGNLFKRKWLKYCAAPPTACPQGMFVWSWDTASSTSENADYSVGTYWYMVGPDRYLLDLVKFKYSYPELKELVERMAAKKQADIILIEEEHMGQALVPSLRKCGYPVVGIDAKGSKETRAMRHSLAFETGRVYLLKNAPWIEDLLKELLGFPAVNHDDQVDSITQALSWGESRNFEAARRSIRGERPRSPHRRVRRRGGGGDIGGLGSLVGFYS